MVACSLFGTFGWSIQAVLVGLCFAVLLYKRLLENPRRRWNVFVMDISKQGFSAVLIHSMNMYLAYVFSELAVNDQCLWYFINLTIDCTLGALLNYTFLKLSEAAALKCRCSSFRTGEYIAPDNSLLIGAWLFQLTVWCLIACLSKALLLGLIYLTSEFCILVAEAVLEPMSPYPQLELLFVMVVVPTVLNCLLLWVQDNFLKAKPSAKQGLLSSQIELDSATPL
jgi:hypothetical protein